MTKLKNIKLTSCFIYCFAFLVSGCGSDSSHSNSSSQSNQSGNQSSSAQNTCGFMQTEASDSCYRISVMNDNGTSQQRSFLAYKGTGSSEKEAAIIFLHGGGGSGLDINNFFQARNFVNQNGHLAIFPSGIGQTWSTSINTGTNQDDTNFLSQIIDIAITDYQIDPQNIFVVGFSAGGFLSYKAACQLSEKITGIVSVAGLVNGDIQQCEPSKPIAIHHIHGTNDNIIPTTGGLGATSMIATLNFWANINNCIVSESTETDITEYTSTGLNAIETKFEFCEKDTGYTLIQGAGHFIDFNFEKLHHSINLFINNN